MKLLLNFIKTIIINILLLLRGLIDSSKQKITSFYEKYNLLYFVADMHYFFSLEILIYLSLFYQFILTEYKFSCYTAFKTIVVTLLIAYILTWIFHNIFYWKIQLINNYIFLPRRLLSLDIFYPIFKIEQNDLNEEKEATNKASSSIELRKKSLFYECLICDLILLVVLVIFGGYLYIDTLYLKEGILTDLCVIILFFQFITINFFICNFMWEKYNNLEKNKLSFKTESHIDDFFEKSADWKRWRIRIFLSIAILAILIVIKIIA